jgi:hypothetical protein
MRFWALALIGGLLAACTGPAATPIIIYVTPSPAGSGQPSASASPSTSTSTVTPGATPTHTLLTPTPGTPRTPTPTEAARLDLEVVEYGFTVDSGDAQYAILLRNPNPDTHVTTYGPVQISFLDASGPVKTEEEYVGFIVPGQTTALTGTASDAGHPTRMEVRLGTLEWDTIDYTAGHFEIDNVKTKAAQYGGYKTTGLITSRFQDRHENIRIDAVYRDAAGKILGGDLTFIDFIDPDQQLSFEITAFTNYKGIASTEIYWQLS